MIPNDKLIHFIVGLLLAQFAYIWIWFIWLPILAGFGKELYDWKVKKTKFDYEDWAATSLGVMPVVFIHLFL